MDYLSIAEAVAATGKSVSTIRRLVKRLADEGQFEMVKKEQTAQGERYLIRRDALFKELGLDIPEDSTPEPPLTTHVDTHEVVVTILREQLQKKDEQIAQLLERQRETNILMNGYQQRLLPMQDSQDKVFERPKNRSKTWVWIAVAILIILLGAMAWWYLRGYQGFIPSKQAWLPQRPPKTAILNAWPVTMVIDLDNDQLKC